MVVRLSGSALVSISQVTLTVLGMISAGMASKSSRYFDHPSRPTQPPTLSGTGNEFQPKDSYAVRLGADRHGSMK